MRLLPSAVFYERMEGELTGLRFEYGTAGTFSVETEYPHRDAC